jgi:hypothetical protein
MSNIRTKNIKDKNASLEYFTNIPYLDIVYKKNTLISNIDIRESFTEGSDPTDESNGAPGPSPTYGAPGPSPTYGAPGPSPTYGAPGPSPTYGAPGPSPTYGAPGPSPTYGAPGPSPTYGAPGPSPTDSIKCPFTQGLMSTISYTMTTDDEPNIGAFYDLNIFNPPEPNKYAVGDWIYSSVNNISDKQTNPYYIDNTIEMRSWFYISKLIAHLDINVRRLCNVTVTPDVPITTSQDSNNIKKLYIRFSINNDLSTELPNNYLSSACVVEWYKNRLINGPETPIPDNCKLPDNVNLNDFLNPRVENYTDYIISHTVAGISIDPNYRPSNNAPGPSPSNNEPNYRPSNSAPGPSPSNNEPNYRPSNSAPGPSPSNNEPNYRPSNSAPGPTSGTSAPGPTSGTSAPGPTSGTSAPGPTRTSAPGPTSGTSAPGPTSGTSAPGPTRTSAPGPTSGTSAPGPTSGTSAPGPTSGTSAPGPTSGTSAPGPTSGTSAPGPTRTSAPGPTSGTSAPGPTRTSAPGPTLETRAPGPTSGTSAPGPTRTSAPGPTSETRAPGPTSETRAPGPTSETRAPSYRPSGPFDSTITTSDPTLATSGSEFSFNPLMCPNVKISTVSGTMTNEDATSFNSPVNNLNGFYNHFIIGSGSEVPITSYFPNFPSNIPQNSKEVKAWLFMANLLSNFNFNPRRICNVSIIPNDPANITSISLSVSITNYTSASTDPALRNDNLSSTCLSIWIKDWFTGLSPTNRILPALSTINSNPICQNSTFTSNVAPENFTDNNKNTNIILKDIRFKNIRFRNIKIADNFEEMTGVVATTTLPTPPAISPSRPSPSTSSPSTSSPSISTTSPSTSTTSPSTTMTPSKPSENYLSLDFIFAYTYVFAFVGAMFYATSSILNYQPSNIMIDKNMVIFLNLFIGLCGVIALFNWFKNTPIPIIGTFLLPNGQKIIKAQAGLV